MVEVTLSGEYGAGNEEDELRSLLVWLRQDESLARQVDGRMGSEEPPAPGGMGTGFDILQLVLGSGLSAGSLAVSFLQWRDARRGGRSVITLRRGETTVEIPARGDVDAALLARVVGLLGEGPAAGDEAPARASSGDTGAGPPAPGAAE